MIQCSQESLLDSYLWFSKVVDGRSYPWLLMVILYTDVVIHVCGSPGLYFRRLISHINGVHVCPSVLIIELICSNKNKKNISKKCSYLGMTMV